MARTLCKQQWCSLLCGHMIRIPCCTRGYLKKQSGFQTNAPLTPSFISYAMPLLSKQVQMPHSRVKEPRHSSMCLRRLFSSNVDSDTDEDPVDAILSDKELKDPSEIFRDSLYPNSQDPLILQLNKSQSVQDVFGFIHKNQSNLNSIHISQCVLILWDLQRVFWQVCLDCSPEDNISELTNYIKAVTGHPDFHNLLRLVKSSCSEFNPDALTCTLLYLTRMGVDRKHATVESLISHCEKRMQSFPLTAISRFLVAVHGGQLWTIAISSPIVPTIVRELTICKDAEQFRLLTICMSNLHYFVTPSLLSLFKSQVKHLLDIGVLGSHCPRTIVKIVYFLDFPRWSMINASLIKNLMHKLEGQIADMRPGDIVMIHRAFQSQLEPVQIVEEIQEFTVKLLENQEPASLPVDVLACVVPFSPPSMKEKVFEGLLTSHIKSPSFPTTMPILFKMLRYLKTSNINICDLFWGETLKFLKQSERVDYKLLRICHKYMYFNNNLGGTYRHFEFEKQMIEWLMQDLNRITGSIPTKFARIAAFIMGYGQSSIPQIVMKKIEEMAPQLSILDCLNISRGLQIATELRSKYRGPYVMQQLVAISSVLSSCTRNHLSSSKLTVAEVNMLMRTYINMKGVSGTDLFEKLLQNYATADCVMNSRLLRDVTFNLNPHRCLVPTVMETMVHYVANHAKDMLGDTVEKLLYFCYWLGYVPENEHFCQEAANSIERDREKMPGLSLLQAALSLCFLQHLPTSLIHYIFTVDFLEHLDGELKLCYSKATYPLRVRQCLMELNRAVCLDYPQADVPWFHTKYCEEQASQDTLPTSTFNLEVMKTLGNVVGGLEYVKRNSYTPYFYKLDYEIILDENNKPIPVKQFSDLKDRQITKVGVLLLREDAFSTGNIQLRGSYMLRRRHLEILNYRQVEISQVLWRAMYMTEEADRQAYISRYIWPDKAETVNINNNTEMLPIL